MGGQPGISKPGICAGGQPPGTPLPINLHLEITRQPAIVVSLQTIRDSIGSADMKSGLRASDPKGQIQGDGPQGTLTSQHFTITNPNIRFLIGGGCDLNTERVELLIDGQVAFQATGKCTETMERMRWNASQFMGRSAQIRLIDASGGGWGHINFDDVRFE